ncbi:MAG: hypothetical protein BZY88_15215 [SAR202 cluster bacterium Io17-Chloro-G9]|nr:MAG: hypothetical protein BZY88_15215 [SAR202 cluster bacterium Io17-Chloro-G9]
MDHEHPLAQEGEPSDLPDPFEDEEDIPELEDDDFPELDDQNELELDDETPTDATSTAADFSGLTVEELISATQDQDWGVRWDAVNELGVRKDIRGVPSLVDRALYDENPHPQWRALWALSAVDPTGAETVPYFLDALEDPDPLVVHYAALGLAFFDRPEARPALLQGTKHADSYRRWESVFSLRTVGSTEVAEAIIPLLDPEFEPDDGVRGEVALALGDMGDMGDEQAVAALLGALENDPNTSVRWRAAMALGSKRDPSLVAKLEAVLTSETDPQVRESTEEAISRLSGT